jgi:hypothetical protein
MQAYGFCAAREDMVCDGRMHPHRSLDNGEDSTWPPST